MSSRNDIKDGSVAETETYGLVYTRKCGWIDLGHAWPLGAHGVQQFWHKMLWESARHPEISTIGKSYSPLRTQFPRSNMKKTHFLIEYSQLMCLQKYRIKLCKNWGQSYLVKKGLPLHKIKSAVLTIFLNTSYGFETMQSSFPYSMFTDSGFSAEDLISDLISFYRAVEPGRKYIELCEPVKKQEALAIGDKYGPVGSYKNKSCKPLLFPPIGDEDGGDLPRYGELPSFLDTIKPLLQGNDIKYVRSFDFFD
jgi:hypothetical protein